MTHINSLIEKQYDKPGLYEDIIERIKDIGLPLEKITRSDIAAVDEFHVRGAEASREMVRDINLGGLKVLDVGCGLGGPARMLAEVFNCEVTGIDMCAEYIRTARKLSELVGLSDKTEFIQGDALNLPFDDSSFDMVWTQHVQMNIGDKARFYSEIHRVLRDGGIFMFYDIFRNGIDFNRYPVPWADHPSLSFLGTKEDTEKYLYNLNFSRLHTSDQTGKGIDFFTGLLEKIKQNGPPKLGLNVLMGASTKEKIGNVLSGLIEDRLKLQSGVYKKN